MDDKNENRQHKPRLSSRDIIAPIRTPPPAPHPLPCLGQKRAQLARKLPSAVACHWTSTMGLAHARRPETRALPGLRIAKARWRQRGAGRPIFWLFALAGNTCYPYARMKPFQNFCPESVRRRKCVPARAFEASRYGKRSFQYLFRHASRVSVIEQRRATNLPSITVASCRETRRTVFSQNSQKWPPTGQFSMPSQPSQGLKPLN